MPEANMLKIISARVTLNLPVRNLKNYSIDINGSGSTLLLTEDIRKGILSGVVTQ